MSNRFIDIKNSGGEIFRIECSLTYSDMLREDGKLLRISMITRKILRSDFKHLRIYNVPKLVFNYIPSLEMLF